jgi:hypothetical protein
MYVCMYVFSPATNLIACVEFALTFFPVFMASFDL